MAKIALTIYLVIFFSSVFGQDTLKTLHLVRNSRTMSIGLSDNIEIQRDKFINSMDIESKHIVGKYKGVIGDSILIRPFYVRDETFPNKKFIATTYGIEYTSFLKKDTIMKVNLKEVNRITYIRQNVPRVMRYISVSSLFTGLILSPIVSIEKSGFNTDRLKKVSITSGIVLFSSYLVITFTINKKHDLIKLRGKEKLWTIQE